MSGRPAITTASLLTERELSEDFVASFRARMLPERFFYWFPLSVRAWLALCVDGDYRNYVRSRSLIAMGSRELAGLVPPGPLEVLSLGSGQGDKDLILLEALRDRDGGGSLRYTPVDTSQALLELACEGAIAAGVEAAGVKADLTRNEHLAALRAETGDPPRLLVLIGNTLGAFDPPTALERFVDVLREGDLLLVDGELFGGESTMRGYDNPINRRFAWAPLHSVGIRDEDGELVFGHLDDPRTSGLYAITKHFEARRDVQALMGGEVLDLRAGERVEMSRSGKYSAEAFLGIIEDAGLRTRWRGTSDDGRFLMVLAARAADRSERRRHRGSG